jgi:hypothetical protein
MNARVVPRSWTQLQSWEQLQRWAQRGGLIVIVDDPTDRERGGPRFHHPDCDYVDQPFFETKRGNAWKNGAYYWVPDAGAARDGQAVPCGECRGQASVAK